MDNRIQQHYGSWQRELGPDVTKTEGNKIAQNQGKRIGFQALANICSLPAQLVGVIGGGGAGALAAAGAAFRGKSPKEAFAASFRTGATVSTMMASYCLFPLTALSMGFSRLQGSERLLSRANTIISKAIQANTQARISKAIQANTPARLEFNLANTALSNQEDKFEITPQFHAALLANADILPQEALPTVYSDVEARLKAAKRYSKSTEGNVLTEGRERQRTDINFPNYNITIVKGGILKLLPKEGVDLPSYTFRTEGEKTGQGFLRAQKNHGDDIIQYKPHYFFVKD